MDLNLDTLKHEILEYLERSGFAVFQSRAGGLAGLPMVTWDCDRYPDYQMFLETPSGKRIPATAEQLKALHEFEDDIKAALDLT